MFDQPQQPSAGDRVLLGYLAVPPRDAYVANFGRDISRRWRYGTKAYLLVHTGTKAATISVPRAWRGSFGLNFGDSGSIGLPALRVPPCRYALSNGVWNVFTGSFSFNARTCAPLIVRVGKRSAKVRFGLGKSC